MTHKDHTTQFDAASTSPSTSPRQALEQAPGQGLRERAEETLRARSPDLPAALDELSSEDVQRLFHELQVHQIELEMQNEGLRQAQQELEASRDRYADLYNFSPVGYLTLCEQGLIREANLTITNLLGVTRGDLIKQPLSRFIVSEDQDIYYFHHKQLVETREPQVCELRMVKKDGSQFWAQIEAVAAQAGSEGQLVYRTTVSDASERKQAEALRKSQATARALLNTPTDVAALLDTRGILLDANEAMAQRFGRRVDELVGTYGWDLLPPDLAERRKSHFDRVIHSGKSSRFEDEREGVWFDTIFYPAFDVQGKVTGVAVLARDISARKQAEKALAAKRKALAAKREALATERKALAAKHKVQQKLARDLGERVKELNCLYGIAYLIETPGISLEEILERTVNLIPPAWQYPAVTCARIIHGGREFSTIDFEETIWKQSADIIVFGERVGAVQVCYREENPQNAQEPFLKEERRLLNSITEQLARITKRVRTEAVRRQAEKELRNNQARLHESEAMLKAQYKGIPVPTYTWRKTGQDLVLVDYNDAAEAITQGGIADFVGSKVSKMYHDTPEIRDRIRQCLAEKTTVSHEIRYTFQSTGESKPLAVKYAFVPPNLVLVHTEDITERVRMEKHLRQQERLAAVGQLAAGIAHDFRNLLTTIMLYAQMSSRQPGLPPRLERNIEIISGESKKAADLIQQILDFSGRSMLQVQVLDLQGFIQIVMDILKRTIPENIRLSLEIEPGQQPAAFAVWADPGHIQQVLTNLAINARDAMPDGGELRFALSCVEIMADMPPLSSPPVEGIEGGAWVCLTVSDTGTGMTEEVRAHLFEPFFTTKDVDKGTGLGLAQVYGIIGQHEGHISVETELGQGTTFCIYLPSYADSDRASEQQTKAEEPPALPQGQGETLLLVEDNQGLREAGQGILESLGYRVLTAMNGREAIAIYKMGDSIDLVITDLVMPEMGGKELAQELHRSDPNVKVLGITGYAVEGITEELKKAGFLDVIRKPFEVETLAHATHYALSAGVGRWI